MTLHLKPPSRAVAAMRRSGIRELMALAARYPDVLHLEVGEPSFATPAHIVEAAVRAARDGFTKYTEGPGLLSLRELLAEKVVARNGIATRADHILVTTGATTALLESFMVLLDPGDAVLLPDPGYPNHEMMVLSLNCEVLRYPLVPEAGFSPDLDCLEQLAARPRVKALLLNSPSNPTGAVFSRETVEAIMRIATQNGLYVVSDEVYEDLVFDGEHVSPAAADDDGRVITVFSFSKSYAMTGWRVGYAVAPPDLAELLRKVQEPVISCATAVAQKAAEAALLGPQNVVASMREEYRRRRDTAVGLLVPAGMLPARPRGAFYVLTDIFESDTYRFAYDLLEESAVAVAPGETFGPSGRGRVRLSLAAEKAVIQQGVKRLVHAVAARAQT